jgi:hypothetical protein
MPEKANLPQGSIGQCPDGRFVYARKGESNDHAMERVCGLGQARQLVKSTNTVELFEESRKVGEITNGDKTYVAEVFELGQSVGVVWKHANGVESVEIFGKPLPESAIASWASAGLTLHIEEEIPVEGTESSTSEPSSTPLQATS